MNPFDRVIINRKEKPASSDINAAQAGIDFTLREHLSNVFAARLAAGNDRRNVVSGFLADGFRVRPKSPTAMSVEISAGLGYQVQTVNPATDTAIEGVVGLSDLSPYKPMALTSAESVTIDAADAVLERYDIIEVRADRRTTDLTSVEIFGENVLQFVNTPNMAKTLSWLMNSRQGRVAYNQSSTAPISLKKGQPAAVGSATVPAATSGYIKIAEIYVGPTVTTLDDDVINDTRRMLWPNNTARVSAKVTIVSQNGASRPVVTELIAPPGVRVVFYGDGSTSGMISAYILAGTALAAFRPIVQVQYGTNAGFMPLVNYTSGSTPQAAAAANSTLQTALNGANASPATKIAIGQYHARCTWQSSIIDVNQNPVGPVASYWNGATIPYSFSADIAY